VKSVEQILTELRPEFDFTASVDFIADGMLDSLDVVTLVAELDKTFNISIDGLDIVPAHFRNLRSIRALLQKYLPSDTEPANGAAARSAGTVMHGLNAEPYS
jgi:acyl carrier protein